MADNNKNEALKGFTVTGLLGYLGYKNLDSVNFTSAKKTASSIMSASENKSEFRQVGETLKSNVDTLREVNKRSQQAALENLKSRFLDNIDDYLPRDGSALTNAEEARAFLSALFDSIREEDIVASGNQTEIDDAIERMYNIASGQGTNEEINLINQDRNTLTSFFRNNFNNEESLNRVGKTYNKYYSNINLFSPRSRGKETFGRIQGQNEIRTVGNVGEFLGRNSQVNADFAGTVQSRYTALQRKFGHVADSIVLKEVNEGMAGDSSLYAQIKLKKSGRVLNVGLHYGTNEVGSKIFRATEELMGSSYVAPDEVMLANRIMEGSSIKQVKYNNLSEARSRGAIVRFDQYIFDDIMGMDVDRVANMSQREINDLTSYQRNFGLDSPRTMSRKYQRTVSESLYDTLNFSRALQGSNYVVAGLESFSREDKKNVVKNLLGFYSEELLGTNASQTMMSRYEDPFIRGTMRSFGNIGSVFDSSGKLAINAYNLMEEYGRKSRDILPQTAREGQLLGRYESVERVRGLDGRSLGNFGIGRNLPVYGSSKAGELIGINSRVGKANFKGMNLSGIFVKEAYANALGLAEGVSYFGGVVTSGTSMPKTIVESGIADTNLMKRLVELAKQGKGLRVGNVEGVADDLFENMSIDKFFKEYGNREGVAVLGHLDSDFSGIKRRGGMEGFVLSLVEQGEGSGRNKYFSSGQINSRNMNTKLFSFLVKDTTIPLTERILQEKLNVIDSNIGSSVLDVYKNRLGGQEGNTLLSSTAQIGKSAYNISVGMFGALEMAGASKGGIQSNMQALIGSDDNYLRRINRLFNTSLNSLENASSLQKQAAYLSAAVETVSSHHGSINAETLGYVLGSVEEFGKKFGYTKEMLDQDVRMHGLNSESAFNIALKSSFVLAAGYGTTGGVHAELGRNLAKVEPRFFNYTYTSLRSNFGLSQKEATSYMSSLLVRQNGVESRASSLFGMNLASMSLSSLNEIDMNKMIQSMGGNLPLLQGDDLKRLLSFKQGDEKKLVDFLSENERGQILDLEMLIEDKAQLKKMKDKLGGRSKIFLPGSETLENFTGFNIRNAGQSISIEGEYNRYLTDLISSINGISEAKNEKEFEKASKGFGQAKKLINQIVGSAMRQSLSGEILGSGSYMGSGIKFGLTEKEGTFFDYRTSREGLLKTYNRNQGYVMFMDAQAFMDGMSTYEKAVSAQLKSEGVPADKVAELSRKRTAERLQDFFFEPYKAGRETVSGLGMRNPNIFITHFFPGMTLARYDFAQGNQDAFFKYMGEYRGTFFDEAGMAEYRARLNKKTREKRLKVGGGKLTLDGYEDFLRNRSLLKSRIDELKTSIYGEPVLDAEGNRKLKEVDYVDKDGKTVTYKTFERDTSTLDPEITKGRERIQAVHDRRLALKEQAEKAKGNLSYRLEQVKFHTSIVIDEENSLNKLLNTPLIENSYYEAAYADSKVLRRSLNNKIDSEIARGLSANNYQTSEELKKVLIELETHKNKLLTELNSGNVTEKRKKEINEVLLNLKKSTAYIKDTISARTKIEGNSAIAKKARKQIFSISGIGKVSYDGVNIKVNKSERTIKPGQLLATNLRLDPKTGRINRENFRLSLGKLDYEKAYNELLGNARLSETDQVRKARELNIIKKQAQINALQNKLPSLIERKEGLEFILSLDDEGFKKYYEKNFPTSDPSMTRAIARDTLEKEAADIESDITSMRTRLYGSKGSPGLIKTLNEMIMSQESTKLKTNKVVATEAILGYYEEKALNARSTDPDFLNNLKTFYGLENGNLTEEAFERNRNDAREKIKKHLEDNIGEGKKYRSVSQAMKEMLGLSQDLEFNSVTRRVWDSEKGEYKTITSSYAINQQSAESLQEEIDAAERIKIEREAALSDDELAKAKENNLYVEKRNEVVKLEEDLKTLEESNQEYQKVREAESADSKKAVEDRAVQLSDEERRSIKESMSGSLKNYEDLTPEEQAKLNNLTSRLSSLKDYLSKADPNASNIDGFESLLKATEGRLDEEFDVLRYSMEEDQDIVVKTSVGEELDRLFEGMQRHHARYGEHGGGLVYIPEINISSELRNIKTGKTTSYTGRMDYGRFAIGDFDADIYQVYHDTNKILANKFKGNVESFHGFHKAGGEYLFNMHILGEGMSAFAKRMGVSEIGSFQSMIENYSKEKILKDVGGIDVQVKAGMVALAQSASEKSASGGDFSEIFRKARVGASLIAVAQEVLVIKSKKLDLASSIAEDFLNAMKTTYKEGRGDALFDFFKTNILREGVFDAEGDVIAENIRFLDIEEGEATRTIREGVGDIRMNLSEIKESFDDLGQAVNRYGTSGGSDARLAAAYESSEVFNTRQMMNLFSLSMEGGFVGTDGKVDADKVFEGLRNAQREMQTNFSRKMQAKSVGGLALGALAASYVVGAGTSINNLKEESKFSDMKTKSIAPVGGNYKDHSNSSAKGITGMGNDSSFHMRPINIGNTYITSSNSSRMYGQAPSFASAAGAAREFTSVGGQAFISVQDNRQPISNNYINRSLRD